jgi:ATP-dependent helicase/DNAse subunit B
LGKKIKFHGVIDRVDVDEERKQIVIYDYKSGQTKNVVTEINDGLHVQLPLYYEAVKNIFKDYNVAGAFLISLKNNSREHGIAKKAFNTKLFLITSSRSKSLLDGEDFDAIVDKAMNVTKEYIKEMYNGVFPANPKDCRASCGWRDICRYEYRKLT